MPLSFELIACVRPDGRTELRAPTVGVLTGALPAGALLFGGAIAGRISSLGTTAELRVPAGTSGRVVSTRRERVHVPVAYGTVLYEIAPIGGESEPAPAAAGAAEAALGAGCFVRASLSGRFWHRAAPGEPPFVAAGSIVEAGAPLGLIEVMKTFSHVRYESGAGLPERARVVRLVAGDGAEVTEGAPLVEVEPG